MPSFSPSSTAPCRAPVRMAVLGAPGTGADVLVAALQAAAPPEPAGAGSSILVHLEPDLSRPTHALQGLQASGCTQAWLMGLDGLPPPAGNGGDAAALERQDAALRDLLHTLGWTYVVFYGPPAARLRQAQALLQPAGAATAASPPAARPRPANQREPAWGCEKCSDPDCERRLFQRLLTPDAERA